MRNAKHRQAQLNLRLALLVRTQKTHTVYLNQCDLSDLRKNKIKTAFISKAIRHDRKLHKNLVEGQRMFTVYILGQNQNCISSMFQDMSSIR